MSDVDRAAAGRDAEAAALAHLRQHGLRLIAQNWRCRRGELDLVMLEGDTVVFVEVRYRSRSAWGSAAESVDLRKQTKLIAAAEMFLLSESRWASRPCRFDVIALTPAATKGLNWIRNAFDAT